MIETQAVDRSSYNLVGTTVGTTVAGGDHSHENHHTATGHAHTTSVNRSFSDLNTTRFACAGGGDHSHENHHTATGHAHTTSVNRSFSDLNTTRFACAAAVLCAMRTAVQHPITLALTRKQTCGFETQAVDRSSYNLVGTTVAGGGDHSHENHHTATGHAHTTSVNRSFSDLNTTRFACAAAVLCAMRTAVQHPITLALTRKQTCGFFFLAAVLCAMRTAVQHPITLALTRKQTCGYASSMSTRAVLTSICKTEGGPRALLQGMGTMVSACALSEALYLVMIEWLREAIPDTTSTFGRDAVSAYSADVSSRFIYLPLSIISFRQMTQYQFNSAAPTAGSSTHGGIIARSGALATLRSVYAEGGVKSVFCGLGMTLLIGSQWSALWWASYLKLKDVMYSAASPYLKEDNPDSRWNFVTSKDDNFLINTSVSMFTSAATSLIFNPFFVLRINMQLTPRATFIGTTRSLYRRGGASVFFSGACLNMLSATMDGVLASTSYEYAKLFADNSRHH
ncbi:mitochondrial carrier protein, putative [Bodo saltans]|uniref:Mitochondrial carrier protein, putative n=1 Tax=Bodo saltans TaxID=75058 RepID=A0A0S4JH99_BODSA|nr:mitochondrial carrier protein, putative [Bodo saltans]|eukprot:CUG90895.1 mitochondrial carrier protein, putative [Bodo saltans]